MTSPTTGRAPSSQLPTGTPVTISRSFLNLPQELLEYLLSFLPLKDLIHLASTNHSWKDRLVPILDRQAKSRMENLAFFSGDSLSTAYNHDALKDSNVQKEMAKKVVMNKLKFLPERERTELCQKLDSSFQIPQQRYYIMISLICSSIEALLLPVSIAKTLSELSYSVAVGEKWEPPSTASAIEKNFYQLMQQALQSRHIASNTLAYIYDFVFFSCSKLALQLLGPLNKLYSLQENALASAYTALLQDREESSFTAQVTQALRDMKQQNEKKRMTAINLPGWVPPTIPTSSLAQTQNPDALSPLEEKERLRHFLQPYQDVITPEVLETCQAIEQHLTSLSIARELRSCLQASIKQEPVDIPTTREYLYQSFQGFHEIPYVETTSSQLFRGIEEVFQKRAQAFKESGLIEKLMAQGADMLARHYLSQMPDSEGKTQWLSLLFGKEG